MSLILDNNVANNIASHAETEYPNECCGFFFGDEAKDRKVTFSYEVSNAKQGDKRRRFEISPDDYRKAEKYALEHDIDLLGVYHSHPDHPAEPSEHDRNVALPYFSYIIVSVVHGETNGIRSWQLNEERQFEEENIEVTEFTTLNKSISNHG